MGARFRVQILGAFAVLRDGEPMPEREVGSRKGRTLLKLLVLERGRLVPVDAVAEALWGEEGSQGRDRDVATLVSRLRRVLGRDAIAGSPAGYRLVTSDELTVDWDEAEGLVREAEGRLGDGEASLASAAADRAVELLGAGRVLEDEPDATWADAARSEAARMVRRARRSSWRAHLELSDPEPALRISQAAAQDDPLDEEAARAVMTALHAAGRTGAALAAFERLRGALAEELGVSPAEETAALHLAILREEPLPALGTTGRAPAPMPAPALDPGFVGREGELERLAGWWADAVAGRPRVVLVCGEAGIGKTSLARQALGFAERTGGLVASGRCFEAERSLFLQPVVDAVRSIVVSTPPDALRTMAGEWAGTLAELVPELSRILRPRDYTRATPEIERRRSFEAMAAFFRAAAARRPMVLFLDDLHLAGASTLELLHFLALRTHHAPLLVLATLRVEEGDEALAQLRDAAERLDVGPLSDRSVSDMAARMGVGYLAERVAALTRGHPLFVVETLRGLAEGPTEGSEQRPNLPESLLATVVARVERTGTEVEEFLRAAATLGSTFDLDMAARLIEVPDEEATRRAERARRARLLVEQGPAFAFGNDLIQEILYRTTPLPVRRARHRRAADLLVDNPEAVGVHAEAAGEVQRAFEAWSMAADRAAARFANRDARLMLDRAVAAARALDDPVGEARALLARARIAELLADYASSFEDVGRAMDLARAAAEPALEMRALRALGGDLLVGMGRPARDCVPYLEQALAIAQDLGDQTAEVDIRSRLAILSVNFLRLLEATDQANRALAIARTLGDERAVALGLDAMKAVSAYGGDFETLQRILPELDRILRRRGELFLLQWAVFESALPPMAQGRWDRAIERIEEALALSARTGYRAFEPYLVAHLGWIARSRGDYGRALTEGQRAVDMAREGDHAWWVAFTGAMLGWTLIDMWSFEEAIGHLERGLEAAQRNEAESYLLPCVAHLAVASWHAGDRPRGAEYLRRAEALVAQATAPRGRAFLHAGHAYVAAARVRLDMGDPDRAETLVAPVLIAAEPAGWVETVGMALLVRGQARLTRGDEAGVLDIERVLEMTGAAGLPRLAWDAHRTLLERAKDDPHAGEVAGKQRLEMQAYVERIADSLDHARRREFLSNAGVDRHR